MQPAVGNAKTMTGKLNHILLGAKTVDQYGTPCVFVVPGISAYDPGISDSLVSAG